jgi:hypothetical protein
MRAEQAREISRSWEAVANHLRDIAGNPLEVRLAERRSLWWLIYSITLAQTQSPNDGLTPTTAPVRHTERAAGPGAHAVLESINAR